MLVSSEPVKAEPVGLGEVRAYCSLVAGDTTVDVFLANAVATVRSMIEDRTGLWLAERVVSVTVPYAPVVEFQGCAQRLASVKARNADGETVIEHAVLESLPTVTRVRLPPLENPEGVTVTVSVLTRAFINDTLRGAVMTGVRNLYTDRSADPVTDEVLRMIRPYLPDVM